MQKMWHACEQGCYVLAVACPSVYVVAKTNQKARCEVEVKDLNVLWVQKLTLVMTNVLILYVDTSKQIWKHAEKSVLKLYPRFATVHF